MAVLSMKLLSIVGPLQEFDNVVSSCLVGRGFHPEDSISVAKNLKGLYPFQYKNPYSDLLKQSITLSDVVGISPDYRDFSNAPESDEEIKGYFADLLSHVTELREERGRLSKLIIEDEQITLQLSYYGDLGARLEDLFNFTYAHFRFGRIPVETYRGLEIHLKENKDCYFFPSSIKSDYVYGMYFAPRTIITKIDSLFTTFHFERIRISGRVKGTPVEAIANLKKEIEESKKRIAEIDHALISLKESESDRFLSIYSRLRYLNDSYDIRQFASHTQDSFYLIGWVPDNEIEPISKGLSMHDKVTYVFDDLDHFEEYTPPTKLVNRKIFSPFEDFVEMYGLPNYRELDPTPLMAICYTLMFGVMFGDIGQGFVLLLAGILLDKLKGIKLGRIIAYAGVSSTLFGIFYGSVFGSEELLHGFHVIESSSNINRTLIGGVLIGVIMITISIITNMINGVHQKDPEKIFFSSNGLAGFVLYWAILVGAIAYLMGHKELVSEWFILFLIVLPLIIIFLKEPLAHFVRHREKWVPESKSEFIMVNLIELFDVILSFLTNTISFVRVGMFALNHAIMMMAVYTLASLSGGSKNIFVLIFGNAFVMLLEGMIVGIQVMRLNFYEMFSRFYTGNGYKYKPFEINYKNNINK
ncbi:MAG: ATPase V [Clostridiales bacterium]|nr:ATPase V [Clostridiales bacterium]